MYEMFTEVLAKRMCSAERDRLNFFERTNKQKIYIGHEVLLDSAFSMKGALIYCTHLNRQEISCLFDNYIHRLYFLFLNYLMYIIEVDFGKDKRKLEELPRWLLSLVKLQHLAIFLFLFSTLAPDRYFFNT